MCVGPGFCSAEQAAAQQSPYGPVLKSEHAEMEGWREKRMWRKWREIERDGDCLPVKGQKKGGTDAKMDGGRELFKERWKERKKGRLEGGEEGRRGGKKEG